jgi:hypothetical protein
MRVNANCIRSGRDGIHENQAFLVPATAGAERSASDQVHLEIDGDETPQLQRQEVAPEMSHYVLIPE